MKSYYADLNYPEQTFFQDKLRFLENTLSVHGKSTSKFLKEFGKDFVTLWGKLSYAWLHPIGIVNRFVEEITKRTDVPAWTLTVPMNYNENDISVLMELYKRVSKFRSLLKKVINDWTNKK